MLGKGLESLIPPLEPKPESTAPSPQKEGSFFDPTPSQDTSSQPTEDQQVNRPAPPSPFTQTPPQKETQETQKQQTEALEEETKNNYPKTTTTPPQEEDKLQEQHKPFYSTKLNQEESVYLIETEKIKPNPYQPRRQFSQEDILELAESIKEFGIIQPLIVSKIEKETEFGKEIEYQLIAGERRLLAAKSIGLERVPAIIREIDQEKSKLEIAIIENLQRENLNPMEAARAFARLADEFRMPQREIALRIGKSREAVANTLRLLQLSKEAQQALEESRITESHARIILSFADYQQQNKLLEEILKFELSVRETKQRAQQIARSILDTSYLTSRPRKKTRQRLQIDPLLQETAKYLEEALSTPVEILPKGKEGGKIQIRFFDREHLRELVQKLIEKEKNNGETTSI